MENLKNMSTKDWENIKSCFFSHNLNEINFHPFTFKTILCPKIRSGTGCQLENCSLAHNYQDDFRILSYSYDKIFFQIFTYCVENELFKFKGLENVDEKIQKINKFSRKKNIDIQIKEFVFGFNKPIEEIEFIPSEFHPYTYKMSKCPFGQSCKLDRHFCLNYHDYSDRIRNKKLFSYNGIKCQNIFDKKEKKFSDSKFCKEV